MSGQAPERGGPEVGWSGDVVVVGAGPAGAHAAACMARAGVRVALVERRERGEAGAQWVNGVAAWMFDEAGAGRPQAPELLGAGHRFTILSPSGGSRVEVEANPVLEVDMRLLGLRLVDEAEAAGAAVMWEASLQGVELNAQGRPEAALVRQGGGRVRMSARLFVDATGLASVLRRQVPLLGASCPDPGPEDLCVAAQEVRQVKDPAAARAWLESKGGAPGQVMAWAGGEGGFSILNVRLGEHFEDVSILTGSIALPRYRSGRRILDDFVEAHPWVGERIFGGAAAIPLRRPYTRLIAPGLALLGNSGCQVFPPHGSGIGIGLIAARMLADAVIEAIGAGEDPGSLAGLWRYPTRFHRRWGGLLSSSDLFRRFSQRLTSEELELLMSSGLITAGMSADTLDQRPPKVRPAEWPRLVAGAARAPKMLSRLLPVLCRMPLAHLVARTYPRLDRSHADVSLFRYERWMRWVVEGPFDSQGGEV